jgi:hypothetical protein
MGTAGGRKRQRSEEQQQSMLRRRVRAKIMKRLQCLFASVERTKVWQKQMQRLFAETNKLKKLCKRYIPIMEVDAAIREKIAEFGPYINRPPTLFPSQLCEALTADFYDHLYHLETISAGDRHPLVVSTRLADIYTCCMCYWLSVGYKMDHNGTDVTIITKHPYFAAHIPPEICFSDLGMTCGHMSEFNRLFKRICTGPANTLR